MQQRGGALLGMRSGRQPRMAQLLKSESQYFVTILFMFNLLIFQNEFQRFNLVDYYAYQKIRNKRKLS